MEQLTVRANGAAFHVARTGAGPPLLLLHGWPEFWLTFEPLMAAACRSLHAVRAGSARLRRQRQA